MEYSKKSINMRGMSCFFIMNMRIMAKIRKKKINTFFFRVEKIDLKKKKFFY